MILISSAAKLLTRFDNELDINLKLSINFILYVINLPLLSSSFLIGTEKMFFPKHSNWPSNSSASSLIIK